MQMYDMAAASTFMQIVYILSDYCHIMHFFQFCQYSMSMIGFNFKQISATSIIKIQNSLWIFFKTSYTCKLLSIILVPHTISIAKCWDSTIFTDASTSEYHKFLPYHSHTYSPFLSAKIWRGVPQSCCPPMK